MSVYYEVWVCFKIGNMVGDFHRCVPAYSTIEEAEFEAKLRINDGLTWAVEIREVTATTTTTTITIPKTDYKQNVLKRIMRGEA